MKRMPKFIFVLILILVLLSIYFFFLRDINPAYVRTVALKREDLKVTVTSTATGTVKAEDEVRVSAQRTGRIVKLNFEEGDSIKRGEIVAELDSREAESLVNQMEAGLRSSDARLAQARVNLEDAERTLKRIRSLFNDGLVSEQEVDTAQKNYNVNRFVYESALSNLNEVRSSLNAARIQYDYSFIRSSMTGIISQRPVELGDTVVVGTLIATIVKPDRLYVKATIDEVDANRVFPGQSVEITIDAFPGKVFKGNVIRVSPIVLGVRQETRTFEVRIGFRERDKNIKPGMSADIEIITDTRKDVLSVPANAVIERKGKKVVYIAEGKRAKLVPVETGQGTWNYIEIKGGLKEGDLVITNLDTPNLKDGARIKIISKEG